MSLNTDTGDFSSRVNFALGTSINSAASIDIENVTGNTVPVLGTVNITSLVAPTKAGIVRRLIFISQLQLTDGPSMVLLGGSNIITDPLDIAEFTSISTTEWRMTGYEKFYGKVGGKVASDGIAVSAVIAEKLSTGAVIPSKTQVRSQSTLADADSTLGAAVMLSGIFVSTPSANRVRTTDTALNIIGVLDGYAVGTCFEFFITNLAAFNETLAAGAGVTLVGNMVVNNASALFVGRVTSTTTITIYRKS